MSGDEGTGEDPQPDDVSDEGRDDVEEVETWPPERDPHRGPSGNPGGAGGLSPPPDHQQARRGVTQPASSTAPSDQMRGQGSMSDSDARNWALAGHLSSFVSVMMIPAVLGPLVVWLVQRDSHPFVEDQAREALNFQISVLIYTIVGAIAALAVTVATLGLGLLVVIPAALVFVVGVFVLPIVGAVKASQGERYRYPLTLRLVSGPDPPHGSGSPSDAQDR